MKHIAILVLDSAWAGSITMCAEMFNVASAFGHKQLGVGQLKVSYIGLNDQEASTFSGVLIEPEFTIYNCRQGYDAVLIPTIWDVDSVFLGNHGPLYAWLRNQYDQGAMLFGLLTGAYLMAEAGLLDGRVATTHWKYADDFRQRYPEVNLQAQRLQTEDERLYCCGGVTASMDFSIQLIQKFCGSVIAQQCERHCLMGSRRDYKVLNRVVDEIDLTLSEHGDARIADVQEWMRAHYAEPLSLEEVGARFGFSQRNLTRRFKAATGITFFQYLQDFRLSVAKALLRTSGHSVQDVCFNVGYDSLTVFGRRFKALTGVSPSQYQKQSISI